MEAEGLSVQMWKKGSGENQEPAAAEKGLSLCVIDGMARVILPDSPEGYEDLMAGDRIDIPSGTKFGLLVGPAGVTMMQGVN